MSIRYIVILLIGMYAITLSWLSLDRHAAHQTNALDLGYYSNTLWNTIHGAPFRFTTYHAANFVFPEFDPNAVKKPDDLLAFHVEPILLPLSLIYWFWPDPRALLILQSLVLASGAWPAYQIARRCLNPHPNPPPFTKSVNMGGNRSPSPVGVFPNGPPRVLDGGGRDWGMGVDYLALAFPLIYLISPSLIGANLSDFHPVAFSAALFLWAFEALERRAYKTYFVFVVLILALKEEMGLMVAMWGAMQITNCRLQIADWIRWRWRRTTNDPSRITDHALRIAFLTIALAAAWTLVAILVQRDAAGRQLSLFAARYAWLGHTPREMLTHALTTTAIVDWLRQPDVIGYLGFLLAQVGFVALFAPAVLSIALPEVAINAFSSFDWQRSGVAHYSAPIVPWLVIAAIIGTARISDWRRPHHASRITHHAWLVVPVFVVLISAAFQFYRAGQLPFTQDFAPFHVTAHQQRLTSVVARIPPNAKVTAQSELYPHVPERADLYLFPTISDADYIVLDVSGQTYPIQPGEYVATVKQLLDETPAGIVVAEDGYLLLARNAGTKFALPDAFFAFARGNTNAMQHPLRVRFGDSVELLGYDFETLPPRQVVAPAANIRTYWRALRPLDEPLRFVYRFYASDGYLRNAEHGSPTERWYPTTRWAVGETIVVEQRGVQVLRGTRIGMRVERGGVAAPTSEPPQAGASELIEAGVVKLGIGN